MKSLSTFSKSAVLSVALLSLSVFAIAQEAPAASSDQQDAKVIETIVVPPSESADVHAEIQALRKRLDELESHQSIASAAAPRVIVKRMKSADGVSGAHKLTDAQKKTVAAAVKKAMESLKKLTPTLKEIDGIMPKMDLLLEHMTTLNLNGIGDAGGEYTFSTSPDIAVEKELKLNRSNAKSLKNGKKIQRKIIINGKELKGDMMSENFVDMSGLNSSLEAMLKRLEMRLQHLEKMMSGKQMKAIEDKAEKLEIELEDQKH